MNRLAGDTLNALNSKCGPYDKDCDHDVTNLMGKLVSKMNEDDIHPGVDHALQGITINSALNAVHGEESVHEQHKSKH